MEDRTARESGELSPHEREGLRSLSEVNLYSRREEDRIANSLRERGLLRRTPSLGWDRFVKVTAAAAALIVSFYLGAQFGGRSGSESVPVVNPTEDRQDSLAPSSDYFLTKSSGDDRYLFPYYRDEPDHPADEAATLAKQMDRRYEYPAAGR